MVYYHEDFFRQIELVPLENYFSLGASINSLNSIEKTEYGFYKIQSRKEPFFSLVERRISKEDLKIILNPLSEFYSEEVLTGYSDKSSIDENTVAWVFERFALFAKHSDGFVNAIWLSNSSLFLTNNSCELLLKALTDLTECFGLVLVDWNKLIVCRTNSNQGIKDYLINTLNFDK
jgi:hypothetical protein